MKFKLLYFNYFKKRIIKSQTATQSYNGPKTANNSAQAYTNSVILTGQGYNTRQGKRNKCGLKFLLLNYSNLLRIKKLENAKAKV